MPLVLPTDVCGPSDLRTHVFLVPLPRAVVVSFALCSCARPLRSVLASDTVQRRAAIVRRCCFGLGRYAVPLVVGVAAASDSTPRVPSSCSFSVCRRNRDTATREAAGCYVR